MSIIRRIEERKRQDAERERELNLAKNDPLLDRFGARRYNWADIEALEEERVPWLKRKRRAS